MIMNCSENENVCSVKKENNLGYYRLHTIWRNDGFFLNIASKDGAWRGEMTSNNIKNMSSQLDMEPSLYLEQCKKALTSHDGQPGMSYSVENGSFTWKKIVDEDSGIKIKMGSVMLEPAGFIDTIQNLVTAALNCNKNLQTKINELNEEKEKSIIYNNELLNKLEELIKAKEEMEDDLYTKFLFLLNSKKKKIKELEDIILNKKEKKKKISTKNTNKSNITDISKKNPYEVDTDSDDSDSDESDSSAVKVSKINLLKPKIKRKVPKERSPLYGESSRHIEETEMEDETISNDSVSNVSKCSENIFSDQSTSENFEKKNEIPSTKDELLDFFYGGSP